MPSHPFAFHSELVVEFRSIRSLDFKKNDRGVIRKSMKLPNKELDIGRDPHGSPFRAARNNAKRLIAGRLDNAERFLRKLDAGDAKLCGARGARNK